MRGTDFLAAVRAHPALRLGEGPRDDRIYVVFVGQGDVKVGWELEPETILENGWEDLEGVLTTKRPAKGIRWLARIVGYYSNMNNWNFSKLAEAADRRKGNYALPEVA
jgi:hypothetical protein